MTHYVRLLVAATIDSGSTNEYLEILDFPMPPAGWGVLIEYVGSVVSVADPEGRAIVDIMFDDANDDAYNVLNGTGASVEVDSSGGNTVAPFSGRAFVLVPPFLASQPVRLYLSGRFETVGGLGSIVPCIPASLLAGRPGATLLATIIPPEAIADPTTLDTVVPAP